MLPIGCGEYSFGAPTSCDSEAVAAIAVVANPVVANPVVADDRSAAPARGG